MSKPTEYKLPPQERLHYFDVMRGISMILVVFAHVQSATLDMTGTDSLLGYALVTFRMPLFFFVSGFFAFRACEKWVMPLVADIMKRKLQAQIICPIVFFSLFQFYHGSDIFAWVHSGFGCYWFTIVLLQCFVVYLFWSLLAKWLRRDWIQDAGMIVCSALALFTYTFFRNESTLWVVLSMQNLCVYMQFFTFGLLCRKYLNVFTYLFSKDWLFSTCIVSFVGFLVFLIHRGGFAEADGTLCKLVRVIFVRYAGLLLVIGYFYRKRDFFSVDNKVNSTLKYIGRRTLDIYMLHYFFLPKLHFLKEFLQPGDMLVCQLFVTLFFCALIIAVCLLLSSILHSSQFLSSWLFGVKLRQKLPQKTA